MKKRLAGILALVLVLSLSIPMAAMAQTESLSLTPEEDQNVIGMSHTVTAIYTVDDDPVSDVIINFSVTAGPNSGDTDSYTTDVNGEATFTYVGDGGYGTDTIVAEVAGDGISATATKLWLYDMFSGGGNIVEEQEPPAKKKDWPKITWGGWAGNGDYSPEGSFEVTFHNVDDDANLDKCKFVSLFMTGVDYKDFSDLGSTPTCPGAAPPPSDANFAMARMFGYVEDDEGSLLGYARLWINGMDNGEPGNIDEEADEITSDGIRFILWPAGAGSRIYDSYLSGDFEADQANPCTDEGVRHELDGGNLQIVWYD
ncbi:hypothetical protein ACFLV5_00465 [Chloroflexota bacterium]